MRCFTHRATSIRIRAPALRSSCGCALQIFRVSIPNNILVIDVGAWKQRQPRRPNRQSDRRARSRVRVKIAMVHICRFAKSCGLDGCVARIDAATGAKVRQVVARHSRGPGLVRHDAANVLVSGRAPCPAWAYDAAGRCGHVTSATFCSRGPAYPRRTCTRRSRGT